jgi:hypothetical protein
MNLRASRVSNEETGLSGRFIMSDCRGSYCLAAGAGVIAI